MSIEAIKVRCDTPDCGAFFQVAASSVDEAREIAAGRWGWAYGDDTDICAPCQRGDTPEPNRSES